MELSPENVSGRASLYAYTWAAQAFHPYFVDKIPYCIAVVELIEQPKLRLTTNIINCAKEGVTTGMEVKVEFLDTPGQQTMAMFRPIGSKIQEVST